MASINKVMLIGNVGQDPQVRYVGETGKVARFSLCTTEVYMKNGEKQSKSEWHNIVVWGKLADTVEKYVVKGTSLYLEGKIQYSSFTGNDGVEKKTTDIVVNSLQFLGSKQQGAENRPAAAVAAVAAAAQTTAQDKLNPQNFSDDLPF